MTDTIAPELTADELRQILQELLDAWATRGAQFGSGRHTARVSSQYSLPAFAHAQGMAIACLYDNDLLAPAFSMVRSAFEAAVTAAWIQQIDDALPAYLNRNVKNQQTLRDTLAQVGWLLDEIAENDPTGGRPPHPASDESALASRRVDLLCDDLVGGRQLYAIYRGLSWMSHPTAIATDLYLHLPPNSNVPTLLIRARLHPDDARSWMWVLCSALVWSARALNLIDDDRDRTPTRELLRSAARRLSIAEFLHGTDEARQRGRRSERQRQQSTGHR